MLVEHDRHEQTSFSGPDVGEVGEPFRARRSSLELALQQVRRDAALGPEAPVFRRTTALLASRQACRTHQLRNAVYAAMLAPIQNVAPYAAAAVGPVARLEALPDQHGEPGVSDGSIAPPSGEPFIEAACREIEERTQHKYRPHRAMFGNEAEFHVGSFAK